MEVVVTDGNDTSTWGILKALLSHHSEFFRAACNGPFKKGQTNKITLPECEPEVFQIFVHWIYFGVAPASFDVMDRVWNAFPAWALADRLMSKDFGNAIMKELYLVHSGDTQDHTSFSDAEVAWCAENAAQGSLLRTWFIDTLALHWLCDPYIKRDKGWWFNNISKYPKLLKVPDPLHSA